MPALTHAERQRAYRRRQRRGLAVFAVALPENDLIAALINAGLLDERRALDAAAVRAAYTLAVTRLIIDPHR
ncbi:hypothetical protein [Niveispirillum sp. KHB5.9]|uniref:hypothetical protein n=1 Tax=Niveispirillum sp. KHB5.9 TaxID=3400269 RepID=UPI003A873BE3